MAAGGLQYQTWHGLFAIADAGSTPQPIDDALMLESRQTHRVMPINGVIGIKESVKIDLQHLHFDLQHL
ncbi:hypothetical protein [Aeromonas sobria]|uniref:hypothetical protein n=1 Tax=Aeromonas sobria TaxID=646 RepID=UPI003CFFDAE7